MDIVGGLLVDEDVAVFVGVLVAELIDLPAFIAVSVDLAAVVVVFAEGAVDF